MFSRLRAWWALSLLMAACADAADEQPGAARAGANTSDTPASYTGRTVGPEGLPGVVDHGGGVIADDDSIRFAIAHVEDRHNQMLWLQELTHRNEQGQAFWIVRAVLILPALDSTEVLSYGMFCRMNGRQDPEIVAIARNSDTEYLRDIVHAWRADRETLSFVVIDPAAVDCANEGYGV